MHGCVRLPNSRSRFLCRLLLVTLAVCALAPAAPAQGLRGTLADPISQDDLDYYESVLQLSTPQRQSLRHAYRAYLDQVRTLREGPVEEYLKANPRAMTVYEVPDDPAVPRKAARELRELAENLRRLDDALFDRLAPSLTETQTPILQRIRDLRKRQRFRQGPAWATKSPYLLVDLSVLIDELDLAPDQRLAIDPALQTYQRSLLAALGKLDEAACDMRLEIAEQKIARAGEAAEQGWWLDAIVIRSVYSRHAKLAGEIGRLHRRLCDEIAPLLDQPALDELLRRYHGPAYPEITPGYGPADGSLLDALYRDDLTGEQYEEVGACHDLYRLATRRIKEDMLDVIDALRISTASHPLQLTSGDGDYYEDKQIYIDKLSALEEELDRANTEAAQSLAAILDIPLQTTASDESEPAGEKIQPRRIITAMGSSRDGPRTYRQMRIPLAQLFLQFGAPIDGGADRFIPAPVSEGDLDRYATRLSLNDDDRLILAALHDAYLERYHLMEADGPVAQALDAQRAMFSCGRDGTIRIPTLSQVNQLFDLRRGAIRQIIELDGAFFDDIAVVWNELIDPELTHRLRNDRLRSIYNLPRPSNLAEGVNTPVLTFGEQEAREAWIPGERTDIGLAALMLDIICDRQTRLAADSIIASAEINLTDLMRRLFETRFEMERLRATMMARHLQRTDDGLFETTSMTIPPEMDELDQQAADLLTQIRTANRSCLEAVSATLPDAARVVLECSYLRRGYPEVYADDDALHEVLIAARSLPDLQPTQAGPIDELSLDYRSEYERLSRLITEAGRDTDARARFDAERAELNSRTRVRLRELLTAEQLARINPGTSTDDSPLR